MVAVEAGHDPEEGWELRNFSVDVKVGRADPKGLSSEPAEALDVVLGAHSRRDLDAADVGGFEDKNVTG